MILPADRIFQEASIWGIGIALFALLVGLMLIGIAARRRHDRNGTSDPDSSHDGYIVSGAVGLMALLLGFTFSLAINRYDARRSLVLVESNAIGTTYLRAQLLDQPYRSRLSDLLRGYTENRIAIANAQPGNRRAALAAQSDEFQKQLWVETVAAIRPIRDVEIASTFVDTMNETIDAGAARVAARRAHIPSRVLVVLAIYMMISAFIMGYVMSNARRRTTTIVLLGLTTIAYTLILDIDRPTGGAIREPQAAMEDLLTMMRNNPPTAFGTVIPDGR